MSCLTIRYSCRQCGLKDAQVSVPARETPEYDIREWMDDVRHCIADSHRGLSPHCRAREIAEVKIPADGQWIGAPGSGSSPPNLSPER